MKDSLISENLPWLKELTYLLNEYFNKLYMNLAGATNRPMDFGAHAE